MDSNTTRNLLIGCGIAVLVVGIAIVGFCAFSAYFVGSSANQLVSIGEDIERLDSLDSQYRFVNPGNYAVVSEDYQAYLRARQDMIQRFHDEDIVSASGVMGVVGSGFEGSAAEALEKEQMSFNKYMYYAVLTAAVARGRKGRGGVANDLYDDAIAEYERLSRETGYWEGVNDEVVPDMNSAFQDISERLSAETVQTIEQALPPAQHDPKDLGAEMFIIETVITRPYYQEF